MNADLFLTEALRLEAVTVSVGFDDLLDVTLKLNHPHLDTMIVVTSHDDKATQSVARKYGAICVVTDLIYKNGRTFNKGAAINAGFGHFQYHGWRMHLDSDIILPDNARRMLFNHTPLNQSCIYGCDRVNVIGLKALSKIRDSEPQHHHKFLINSQHSAPIEARFIDTLHGYVPIGFFQLFHASCQQDYPYSLGTAAHDDVLFATQWQAENRRHLPEVICYHLMAEPGKWGQNWDGRTQPRLKR